MTSEARLHPGPRRHRDLAAAVLSLAAARRRLRHRRLPRINPAYGTMRDFRRFVREAHERGLRVITELVINHTSDQHPWFQRARRARPGSRRARLLRLERHRQEVPGHAHHLPRHRDVELDLGPGRAGLFLAPLLSPPAGSQLRQSARARGGARDHALLARHGRRRPAARRHPLPRRARGHQLREPAGDARRHQADPRRARRPLSRPHAAGRGQPVAGGHARPISATATNATWRSTSR